jgi:hypothetical protein
MTTSILLADTRALLQKAHAAGSYLEIPIDSLDSMSEQDLTLLNAKLVRFLRTP